MPKAIDITGKKYGRLIAIEPHHRDKHKQWHWLFKCDCGKFIVTHNQSAKSGGTKSCGCLNVEKREETHTKHNMARTRFYHGIWAGIKQRCLNGKANGYKNYGGKGVKLCKSWYNFENFRDDMHKSYIKHVFKHGEKNTQIDRIDNTGDYEPSNCRWVTCKEQQNNKIQYARK